MTRVAILRSAADMCVAGPAVNHTAWQHGVWCLQTMEELAHYLMTDDFWHAAVAGWMWWAWNPNSIDTGGIVSRT
jgi:hypothetical protein